MKNAAGLSRDFEYASIWTGQSNSRPWGYPEGALIKAQELRLEKTGINLIDVVIPDDLQRKVGMSEVLLVSPESLVTYQWNTGTWLRLGESSFGFPAKPAKGYAKVIENFSSSVTVTWLSLPDNPNRSTVTFDIPGDLVEWTGHGILAGEPVRFTTDGTLPPEITVGTVYYVLNPGADDFELSATPLGAKIDLTGSPTGTHTATEGLQVNGYLVREGGQFYGYEQVRVLSPYLPNNDIETEVSGATPGFWFPRNHAPYPTPDGRLGAPGRRLTLPPPYTLPSAVTTFDDLALFLPLTRREGSTGYGISEIADGEFNGAGIPTGHPITTIAAGVFTFLNAINADADLTGAYLIVDWEAAGVSQRSWARIAENTDLTFKPDPASWLGDGEPATPTTSVVTPVPASGNFTWASHGLLVGDRVAFFGGTPPTGITFGRVYSVVSVTDDNNFKVAESMDHHFISFPDVGAAVEAVRAWIYTAWTAHWKDNPYMWIPGPEFGRMNEDQMPQAPFIHWRARGQLRFASQVVGELGGTPGTILTPFDGVSENRFGAMLPFGWRFSAALGKRLNLVCLGCNGVPLTIGHIPNTFGHRGVQGWYNYEMYGFGLPLEDSTSQLSKRLKRLITFIAGQALLAEGITKKIQYLAACHVQGETDSLLDASRELYAASITDYKDWLRELIDGISASPFEGEAKMPFVQPVITRDPWETQGTGNFQEFGVDALGETNNAIKQAHVSEEFSDYTLTEDIPKLLFLNGKHDNAHFSSEGMLWQGARLAAAALDLLEHALSYSSSALDSTNPRLLRIANLALVYVGEGGAPITSLADTSEGARLVALMLPEATRQLLSMRQWSWATRREPATQVKHQNPDWLYCYVVPARAVTVIEILQPVLNPEDAASGASTVPPTDVAVRTGKPEPFEIMRSASGHRLLFTDVAEIPGDLSESPILDGALHPERLPIRPQLRYVDKVVDPDRYGDSFTTALTWLLASMLAPALIKGQEGEVVRIRCLQTAAGFVGVEATHESVTHKPPTDYREEQTPIWIGKR
jgi:hypothetical protein